MESSRDTEIQELKARLTRVEDQLEKQARELSRRPSTSIWRGAIIAFLFVFIITIISVGVIQFIVTNK